MAWVSKVMVFRKTEATGDAGGEGGNGGEGGGSAPVGVSLEVAAHVGETKLGEGERVGAGPAGAALGAAVDAGMTIPVPATVREATP